MSYHDNKQLGISFLKWKFYKEYHIYHNDIIFNDWYIYMHCIIKCFVYQNDLSSMKCKLT